MDFALDDDQAMVKALAERFVTDRYPAGARAQYRSAPRGYAASNWALLAELGLLAIPFAEADGGLGGGAVEIAATMEAFGRGLVCEPVIADLLLGGCLIAQAGTSAQKAAWLGRILAGTAHVGFAYAEYGTRYDLGCIETRIEDGRLVGTKTAVEGGGDGWVVTARDGDAVRLWLVASDAPGLTSRAYRLVDGTIACELTFDATPGERMDGGLETLGIVVDHARIAAIADMTGAMDGLFAATLNYVKQRRQFGVPIGTFQAIQHRLADQYAALEQARSHFYAALSGDPAAIAGAKSYVGSAAIRLGEECIQLHGGMGVSDELDVGHWHKRILRLATLFGDPSYEQGRYDGLRRQAG